VFNIHFNIKCCPYQEVFIYNQLRNIRCLGLIFSFEVINYTLPYTLACILVIICVYFLGLNHLITPIGLILVGAIFVYNFVYMLCV